MFLIYNDGLKYWRKKYSLTGRSVIFSYLKTQDINIRTGSGGFVLKAGAIEMKYAIKPKALKQRGGSICRPV